MTGLATQRALLFTLGGRTLCLPSRQVQQVIAVEAITPVPRASAALLGLVTVRGDIVPLVDLAQLLSVPGNSLQGRTRAVVVGAGGHPFAFPVDDVLGFEMAEAPLASTPGALVSEPVRAGERDAEMLDTDAVHGAFSQTVHLT